MTNVAYTADFVRQMSNFTIEFVSPTATHGPTVIFNLPMSMVQALNAKGWGDCFIKQVNVAETLRSSACELIGNQVFVTLIAKNTLVVDTAYKFILVNITTFDYAEKAVAGDYSLSITSSANQIMHFSHPMLYNRALPVIVESTDIKYIMLTDSEGNKLNQIDIPIGGFSEEVCVKPLETWEKEVRFSIPEGSDLKAKGRLKSKIQTAMTCFKFGLPGTL